MRAQNFAKARCARLCNLTHEHARGDDRERERNREATASESATESESAAEVTGVCMRAQIFLRRAARGSENAFDASSSFS